jgi:hypothetical protein
MRGREPIMPHRRRRVPPQFSWIDHRLVRDGHLQGRSASALALYLFLVTVADADGLSWYSEETLCRELACAPAQLHRDRSELQQAALIAYRRPLYQVLDLAPAPTSPAPRRGGEAVAVGDILKSLLGGAR